MTDTIEILLKDKPHIHAQKLLSFHRTNPEFLPRMVAEFRLLKKLGRKKGGAKAMIHFLRWEHDWQRIDEFEINDHLRPLAIRVCALLWPDINGMVRFLRCKADDFLGTRIERRGTRTFVYPGKRTLGADYSFVLPQEDGEWLVRPIQRAGVTTNPPPVPTLARPATFHRPITEPEAVAIATSLHDIVASAPKPGDPLLRTWLLHVEAQPEIFTFMEQTLLRRRPKRFSANSLLEYARWSIRRAAASHKRFTLPNNLAGFYCRALIMLNPEFNGLCEFREDSSGTKRTGQSNKVLGCTLAPEPINNEPYRRLSWRAGTK